jgi:hypothetical protein
MQEVSHQAFATEKRCQIARAAMLETAAAML